MRKERRPDAEHSQFESSGSWSDMNSSDLSAFSMANREMLVAIFVRNDEYNEGSGGTALYYTVELFKGDKCAFFHVSAKPGRNPLIEKPLDMRVLEHVKYNMRIPHDALGDDALYLACDADPDALNFTQDGDGNDIATFHSIRMSIGRRSVLLGKIDIGLPEFRIGDDIIEADSDGMRLHHRCAPVPFEYTLPDMVHPELRRFSDAGKIWNVRQKVSRYTWQGPADQPAPGYGLYKVELGESGLFKYALIEDWPGEGRWEFKLLGVGREVAILMAKFPRHFAPGHLIAELGPQGAYVSDGILRLPGPRGNTNP